MSIKTVLTLSLFMALASNSSAGWWIFGQGANEVRLTYLHVCGTSVDEAGPKVKIPRSALKDGQALVKGRAAVRKGKIGAVQVSLAEPAEWQKARLSADGTFEFSFAPETGKTYKLSVKALDTAGKTNDIAATERELEFSDMDIRAGLVKALDGMIAAYQAENAQAFMAFVSPEFAGDAAILDYAVRRDFTAFNGISLAYTLSGVSSGQSGRAAVTLNFRRQVISARDGQPYADSGVTEFVFRPAEQGWQIWSMKNPLIFGLSDASEVGTGTTVQPTGGDDIIIVGPGGTVTTVAPEDIGDVTSEPASPIAASGSRTLNPGFGIFFETDSVESGINNPDFKNGPPDTLNFRGTGIGAGPVKYKAIPACTGISNIMSVDGNTSAYATQAGFGGPTMVGACYAVYLPGGKFGAFEITGITPVIIRHKFQPNGTNLF